MPHRPTFPAGPPIDGQCTDDNGKRVCLSAVCDADDDKCGLKNGEPCAACRRPTR
jgi:hypothetical protein